MTHRTTQVEAFTNHEQRVVLRQMSSSWPTLDSSKSLHLLEELEQYTSPGFFLHDCSFDQLVDLVKRTYHAFGSTYSAHMALSKNEDDVVEYFRDFLDPSIHTGLHQLNERVWDNSPAAPKRGNKLKEGEGDDNDEEDSNGALGITHLAEIDVQFGEDRPKLTSQEQRCGDTLRHNNILLWRDLLHYWEMKCSAKEGDVGCLFEMNKV